MRGIRDTIITGAAVLSVGLAGAASASASAPGASTAAPRTVLACGHLTVVTPHARVTETDIRAENLRCAFSLDLARSFALKDTTVLSCGAAVSAYHSCTVDGYSCRTVGRNIGERIPIACSAGLRSVKFYEAESGSAG